jgi:hypothetical protein
MLLYGVLEQAAHSGQPDKNADENNRMPRWSNERTTRRSESSGGRIFRHRIWNCPLGDQASSPSRVVDDAAVPGRRMGQFSAGETGRSGNPAQPELDRQRVSEWRMEKIGENMGVAP